ncbi:hypothetical protein VTJ04DRAFT_133 [Mycothermus thermophilus]|uniref:uncharacterized protein n=1 Tax=Humicola insolens TaxID=85995 RepID=UPI00374289A3
MLDLEIHKRNLPSVVTNGMYHLAPVQLYQRVKPYKCHLPTSLFPDFLMTNLLTKPYSVTIFNVAGFEHLFTLAQSGFEFARFPVNVQQWTDQTVKAIYLPTLAQWLKKSYGARDVHFYTYNFRYHNPDDKPAGQHAVKSSFLRAHCDASQETIEARLKVYYPDTYQQLLQGRVQYLNIWRPITSTPVEDCPLAVCDFRTIDQGDLVPMDLVYPHYVDEAYEVLYNPAHRWFYKKGMTHEDVVIFKLCDNLTSEAYVCPHAAFLDPTAQANAPPRASIEVKAILMG